MTLAEIMGPNCPSHFHVWVNGEPVGRESWDIFKPQEGAHVNIGIVSQKGNTIRMVLLLVVAVVAAVVGQYYATAGLMVAALGETGAAIAGAAITAAIGVAGSLLVNALIPPQVPKTPDGGNGQFKTIPGIGQTTNRLLPYGVVPEGFGDRIMFPPQAAKPYTEIIGREVWLRQLFAIGIGEYDLSEFKIGDTEIENFQYQMDIGESPALFPQAVEELVVGTNLQSPGDDSTRTTDENTDEISIDLVFPQGLFSQDTTTKNAGKARPAAVDFRVEFRPVGEETWTNIMSLNPLPYRTADYIRFSGESNAFSQYIPYAPGYSYTSGGEGGELVEVPEVLEQFVNYTPSGLIRIQGSVRQTERAGLRWAVARGQYDVRVTRVNYEEGSGTSPGGNHTQWTILRSIQHRLPTEMPGVLKLALTVKANDEMAGGVDTFNLRAKRKLPVWNGTTWSVEHTRRGAWAWVQVLTGISPANLSPVSKDKLVLEDFLAWAQFDEANNIYYDDIWDTQQPLQEVLNDIAGACFATRTMRSGKYGIVRDVPQEGFKQIFTPRNSWGFKGVKAYPEIPDAVRVSYYNEAENAQDDVFVYNDGFTVDNAVIIHNLSTRGIKTFEHAWKYGRWHLAQLKLRPEIYTMNVSVENLYSSRGDLVGVQHDVPLWALASGRVIEVILDEEENIIGFVGDEAVAMDADKSYRVRVRRSNATTSIYSVQTVFGERTEFTFIEEALDLQSGDIYTVMEFGTDLTPLIISKINPAADLTAQLTLLDAAQEIHQSWTGDIPEYQSNITERPDATKIRPPKPNITGFRSDESVLFDDNGVLRVQAYVDFTFASSVFLQGTTVEGRIAPSDSPGAWSYTASVPGQARTILFTGVEAGTDYVFEIRTRTATQVSDWETGTHTVVGLTTPPPDVPWLQVSNGLATWGYPDKPRDFDGFGVFYQQGNNPTRSGATPAYEGLLPTNSFDVSNLGTGTITVLVVAVDKAGNESENPAVLVIDLAGAIEGNVVEEYDYHPTFAGTVTGGSVTAGELQAASSGLFWPANDSGIFWPTVATFWTDTYAKMIYETSFTPSSDLLDARLLLDLGVTASSWKVEYRTEGTDPFWPTGPTFWDDEDDTFWPALPEYSPWNGHIDGLLAQPYYFRLTTEGGNTQGIIDNFSIVLDLPDIEEILEDVELDIVANPGGTRLPITKPFRVIRTINPTLQDDGGDAVNILTLDKDPVLGPLQQAINGVNTPTSALADFRIRGY